MPDPEEEYYVLTPSDDEAFNMKDHIDSTGRTSEEGRERNSKGCFADWMRGGCLVVFIGRKANPASLASPIGGRWAESLHEHLSGRNSCVEGLETAATTRTIVDVSAVLAILCQTAGRCTTISQTQASPGCKAWQSTSLLFDKL